ncbi:MAG: SDR family NAD(P)-dependent oxidoreductase [Acidimicrobiaceae bacterium]|nr:SDR family NAD(P)-dependent oxidoreductase [Acidimicrobiaceae bacterium]MYB86299.1 SDR family NAD(P)-dependent oxidoreductase [Acidimicrobiaceae bacterium]MYH92181.1 SDR family NAD(P)-dependent oxidoreductase [Acidimicrobiaceae bacterium]
MIDGSVAVVTGGAGGIGKGIAKALLGRGARVVIADIEAPALEQAVGELAPLGSVEGVPTDVSDEESVTALADHVFEAHGACNLLFCNAGVTSGGGGKPWQQEPNDWRWCFGVNVFGVAICTWAFVPRMIAGGEPGQVIVTSSGDGGFAPVPTASVYASSKAAASCFTEALNHNLISEGTNLRASVFYPSGGMMDTGLFNAQRNRPEHLQRVGAGTGRGSLTFEQLKEIVTEMRGEEPEVADLDELGEFVLDGVAERRYIIARDLDETAELLHSRADAIGRAEMPPGHNLAT